MTGAIYVSGEWALGSDGISGNCLHDLVLRQEGVACESSILQRGDDKGADAAEVRGGIQTRRRVEWVLKTDRVFRENATVHSQEPNSLGVVAA